MRRIALLFIAMAGLAACGRPTPASITAPLQTTVTQTTIASLTQPTASNTPQVDLTEPVPNVVGTFEAPSAGVKVTSANTVLEPLKQSGQTTTLTSVTATTPAAATSIRVAQTYVVESGDTISGIANDKFGIKISQLLAVNELSDRDEIKPGQVLKIPAS